VGACDDLSIPRPLAPFHDIGHAAAPALERALAAGAPPHEIQALLIAELRAPAVVVLEDVREFAVRRGELQRIVPALELETEWALTRGAPLPVARLRRVLGEITRTPGGMPGWAALRAAAWASVAGLRVAWELPAPGPHGPTLRRDWAAAADAFGAVGQDYDRGPMLSLLDDAPSLAEAIEIARRVGAAPLPDRHRRVPGDLAADGRAPRVGRAGEARRRHAARRRPPRGRAPAGRSGPATAGLAVSSRQDRLEPRT
jgi:hypothetical protein